MFEAHVLHLLRRYLGEYVQGLSLEALRISVWKGDVVLKDLKLRTEALNSLRLPVTVKAGFVGTITLKVPWKSLGKEPVIVLIDRVFVLVHPALDGETVKEEDREKLFEAKLQQIEEAESATLEAISRSKLGNPPSGNSWLGSLISTIIGNLKISISNVHIRYEDSVSNPGYPFCTGVTLAKLAAVTMDEQGNETFDTSGALDKLRKLVQLDRLAMYHDSNTLPWNLDKKWEDLSPKDWIEVFEDGINEPTAVHGLGYKWAVNRNYLVSPINGILKYHRLGNLERNDPEIPYEKASLVLGDVSLTITEAQYHDWIKLLEVVSRYKTFVEVSHLRPMVPVLVAPNLWWRYAVQACLQQKKMCYRFSWERIRQLCQLRRRYIQLYAGSLQRLSNTSNVEIREIEKDLDSKVILLWRLLAHAKIESVKSKEAAEQKRLKKSSWFSFRWRANSEDTSDGDASEGSYLGVEQLTKEEWQAINKLLSCQQDEDSPSHSGKDAHNMVQFLFTVSINQAAARIININQTEIVCGRFEQLSVSTKLKHRSTYCDVLLKFYGLSAPEGSLAQSVSSEQKANALAASFIHMPVGENIDWRLSATISPCHVTTFATMTIKVINGSLVNALEGFKVGKIFLDSCDRFLEFLRRSNEVSPTVALETATALQVKFEKVTRRAQEQFQTALEEQSRFALDIDLDAPKVRVPIRSCSSSKCDSHFLLDFGHFMLRTMGSLSDERRHSLYSRFFISGRDIAALFRDCGPECQKCSDYSNQPIVSPLQNEESHNVYPLLDQCGMAVIVDQIKVPHPSYPSTRISIQVPNLGIHFSPARYCKLMELLNTIYGKMETYSQHSDTGGNFQPVLATWGPVDLTADARILVWRGIGNSVPQWKPCYIVLSGLYIYVLESGKSQVYQRYMSVAGKQVHEVPSTSVGGSLFCIALSSRGMDIQRALESSSTWVIEFQNEEEKSFWTKRLLQATYLASAPPSMNILGEMGDDASQLIEHHTPNMKAANLVINGALVEAKLLIYGKTGDEVENKLDEILILELLASGGKVHIILGDDDLSVKTKLHSLHIKDELQGHLSTNSQYLARSVLSNEKLSSPSETFDPNGIRMATAIIEEDDSFKDALPDFLSLSDVGNYESSGRESTETIFNENDIGKGKDISSDIFYEAEDSEDSNFVAVTFLTRGSDSPDYDGIDTQMSIRMSKMEFYCNRPTLVALIGFGLDISSANYVEVCTDMPSSSEDKPVMDKEKVEEKGRVKGLLGYGKSRVVFYLNMNVDSVSIYLNMEDGSQLAMLVQERFLFDLKIHPSSLSIEGTLGNFRLCDMSLGEDHCWGWLCDIRNPGVESLIKFKFHSYSADDDDYEGYDYSLHGRLSAVRIVFLYRFVQEITVYFMGLATPHTEEAVKLVDKVGDFEWLIQKYEIDGAAALKLDLSLDTPIIIVPKDSNSKDFMQLDLGQLQITNEFSWHGCPEKDASAVHIDVLHAEILGVNMLVGINGCLGKPMIQEGQGLKLYVRRSLRDVFRKVPTFSLEIVVELLHGMMSDKEYKVIIDCLYMNLYEQPTLPPSFRGKKSESKDTMRLLVDIVNTNSQILLSRTVTIVSVVVNKALLELYNGIQEESPLALIALEGLWVSYRMTSFLETDLYLTIPKFSILDIRPGTKPEMRLMLGSSTDTSKQAPLENLPFMKENSVGKAYSEGNLDMDVPVATMFVLDNRWRKESQSFVLRVQQPRVLVVPDFLLAVVEFFVPALRTITGREETMDPKNDPISRNNSIVLSGSIHRQSEDVILLSSSRQLIADTLGVDDYTYDGCGNIIRLMEETDGKGPHSGRSQPIIVIGRAKRLRFVNVKIENGSLLRKYTYLANDSSYSVSKEDDVDIVFLDTLLSEDEKENAVSIHETSEGSNISSLESDQSTLCSFTFETQVVSPEFTFYDGTKSSLDDLSYGEKLLRAKLDMSFMYASKENDTWIRALVKDFTVEAGSGLVILDPVDVSGGYTSVKDKTNMSLVTTDICIHLSLSAISLILNLQSQAVEAMMFGNAVPLIACTNFDKLWVSPRDNGSSHNLTFWRPRAPPNYVILGDCVTSRPIPPSQAVMAVSNTYGRVRKPTGFHKIGVFSRIQGFEVDEKSDIDCSIWMPVSPVGYTAMGCVVHVGHQPPPTYVVYCIRSDLVSSTTYSECLLNSPSNSWYGSGYSIWRMDNVIGSFVGHASTDCPEKDHACDLNHLITWNSNPDYTFSKEPSSNTASGHDSPSQNSIAQGATSSGWDILRSVSKATNCYLSTPNFERIWWDKGSDRCPVSIWRPLARPGYAILGDFITEGLEPPALGLLFKAGNAEISAKPLQFTKVAHIFGKGFDEAFFWYPIAPPGYASFGCVVSRTDEAPPLDSICCPRMDLVSQANIFEMPISRSLNSRGSQCWSIWKVSNQACTFLARADHKIPSSRLAYTIGDAAKPKAHDNVTAEMKIRFFSLTVLDSLQGMMKPLFDTTVTNIKLATHGSLEAMNAVLISSIAASTFNTQLEAWEPLIEPFDGIFKFETYDTSVDQHPKLGKRIRIAATSIVNINVSASNLETFIEGILSWRRQLELEERVQKLNEEAVDYLRHGKDATFSALDEDDLQTAVVENKLGCEIYLKRYEQNLDIVDKLSLGDCVSVWIPPPRFSDRLNVADESREPRYYVAVQIIEAKGLPVTDDGNSHSFFCALRLVIEGQVPGQQKLFPQSARTKCVKPLILGNNLLSEGMAKWNELFIFEVPRKGSAKLEVEVTNLAAKAGKGEVVGALSVPVGHGSSVLKKVASVRMVHQTNDVHNIVPYTLKKKSQQINPEDMADCGILLVSTSYFERRTKFQRDAGNENLIDRETGFWIGLRGDGEWENIRSLLPLSTVPILLQDDYIAMDVAMRNGKKHAILRGLVTVVNDSDVKLDISICHVSLIEGHDASLGTGSFDVVVEETFENQRYHPNSGWSDQLLGLCHDDPRHWSTRDFSHSSKDFFEPPLPPGWQWTTTWTIDKTRYVDNDGWGYGPDFHCLNWPLTSSKSCKSSSDVVRQRRWVRTRQKLLDRSVNSLRTDLASINPGSSASLPWRSTLKVSDQCLLVRPSTDQLVTQYTWGRAAFVGSVYACGKDQVFTDQGLLGKQANSKQENKISNLAFKLNQLEKKDMLLCCNSGNKQFWLSIGADASVLHTELNAPVYDWKISVNSPIKLENRLPCSAEFTIWEKTKDGKCIERQNGTIFSRGSEQVYSADAQKPLYLTLFVQGGWALEKDPILLLNPLSNDPISPFWMVHQKSRRRLRLSMERVMGGTTAGPKIIRFHVPYWIINDSSLSLAYRVLELEPPESVDSDSLALSRAVKSAKMALRNPINSLDRRHSSVRRNTQVLEEIEDTTPVPCMLSPQDYASRSGGVPFASQKETHVSPRVGISIAMRNSDIYSPGLSLLELENKERVDVKAFSSDGSYYKLSTVLSMTSDRTKVVRFQPHTLFINRLGCSLCLQQCDSQLSTWFHPSDPPKPFGWQSYAKVELLKLRVEGYKWSIPFSIHNEGMMRICLRKDGENDPLQLRVEVRSGAKCSRYEVIFRPNISSGPYRIENRSVYLPIRFRQVDGTNDSWKLLLPNTAVSFLWEDLGRRHLLELLIDGSDSSKTEKYDIDEISDHQPVSVTSGPSKALHVTVVKEEKINVLLIRDWMPENEPGRFLGGHHMSPLSNSPRIDFYSSESASIPNCEYHIIMELAELGISLVDHTPEEILYLSVQNLLLAYSTGLDSGISRLKLRMSGVQIDNQLPLTPMPVLFRPQRIGDETDYILKFSMTMQSNGSLDLCIYPYIGFHGPESYAFSINIHEPIIWRLHEMIQLVNLSRLQDTGSTAVSVDPVIQIRVLHISEVRFRLSMAMSPSQRPRGVLGFWSSLMTALGNTENMPIRINQRFRENICMRQSTMVTNAISSIRKDLLSQPLQLLSGVDILGNASSALGHMSKGVAALSMDKKFIQSRQRQENKGVEDLGDVIREGGGALAKGLFRGVTGILTKPLEGAKTSGVEGFVQGVGKGIIGAAAQPVSGVLDLLSKTTEGANAVRMKIASAITSDEQLLRRRLPRVIGGDNLLRPYDNYKAQGQVILQLAESGSFFVQVDLFKVRGKFALSDAYEDHFLLPKGKILVVTHRRVILMQQPSTIIAQRKFSPAKDPCSVSWDVLWSDLVTMELSHGKKDHPKSPPSRLILYLQARPTELKEHVYVVKCSRGTDQSLRVYSSIERAMNTYGQNQSKEMVLMRVRKPYSPISDGAIGDYIPKEGTVDWSPQPVSASVPFTITSAFGSSSY